MCVHAQTVVGTAEGMVAGGIGSKQGGSYAERQAGAKVQRKQGMQRATGGRQRQK